MHMVVITGELAESIHNCGEDRGEKETETPDQRLSLQTQPNENKFPLPFHRGLTGKLPSLNEGQRLAAERRTRRRSKSQGQFCWDWLSTVRLYVKKDLLHLAALRPA